MNHGFDITSDGLWINESRKLWYDEPLVETKFTCILLRILILRTRIRILKKKLIIIGHWWGLIRRRTIIITVAGTATAIAAATTTTIIIIKI